MHTGEMLLRWLIGGVVVSFFALLGDLFKPKSFAGLFGGAPSVALATLGLAIMTKGSSYAATEARSMAVGAIALVIYTSCAKKWMLRSERSALTVSSVLIPLWAIVAFALWAVLLR